MGGARAFGQLDSLLFRQIARLFVATLGGVVLLYLVVDFADGAHNYRGRAWGKAVLELYANKAAVVGYQLAPGALIIAAVVLITQLARRGELVGLFALGIRPARLAAPIAVFAAVMALTLFLLGEKVVVGADARAEEIQVTRFGRWGNWGSYHAVSSWLRGKGGRIYHLGASHEGGFEPATVLEIEQPFHLARRIDARRIEPAGRGLWRLLDATETRYTPPQPGDTGPGGGIAERRAEVMLESFPETAEELALPSGRPRQLPWTRLREQTERRERLGQPVREYRLALAERAMQPLLVIPATLAALGLALWRGRGSQKAPLAGAVALGIGLSMVLWAVSVVAHAAALSGTLSPWVAGALPSLLSGAVALATLRLAD